MVTPDDSRAPESWHPIPSLPGFEVSSRQRIRHVGRQPRSVTPTPNPDGYLVFKAGDRLVYLHHVVAEVFIGPRPSGMQVRHLDDVRSNNRPTNLSYGTQAENIADSLRNGTFPVGERNGRAKLTEGDVATILRSRESACALASRFGVSDRAIRKVRNGETWRYRNKAC